MSTDICIVGAGLCGTLIAERLSEQTDASILLLEGGRDYPFEKRESRRQEFLDYQHDPWPGSKSLGSYSAVGGRAIHWGAHCPRFTEEDFATWPLSYSDLEPHYCDAEELIGVSGDGTERVRSRPLPQPPLPWPQGVKRVHDWTTRAGLKTGHEPYARNSVSYRGRPACTRCDTCYVCPTGAKYSPDQSLKRLVASGRVQLESKSQVFKLETDPSGKVTKVSYRSLTSGEEKTVEASQFILAGGTVWTSALLLHSGGLANSSGLVGKRIAAHPQVVGHFHLGESLYPGQYGRIGLQCDQFMREEEIRFELRFDVRLPPPNLRSKEGTLLLGDSLLEGWKAQINQGRVRLRCFFEVPPIDESKVEVSRGFRPDLSFKWSPVLAERRRKMEDRLNKIAKKLDAAGSEFLGWRHSDYPHHPAGGCVMGEDPDTSVCDVWGRTHDHPNLWVAGAPLCPTGGCTSSSLTFAALALRSASAIVEELKKKPRS